LFGCGESGEGEGSRGAGGELQHLAAGVDGFGHRGNLRTIVWIPNYEMRKKGKNEGKARRDKSKSR
jgi:hypothetical protein